jgi:hypothetical protein
MSKIIVFDKRINQLNEGEWWNVKPRRTISLWN